MARRFLQSFSEAFAKRNHVDVEADTAESIYTPLSASIPTIRLLCIQPGTWDDAVETELRDCSLTQARDSYIAISYNWGRIEVDRPVMIRCNGKAVFVTSNLFAILRRLRQPDQMLMAWADALCINQADIAERTYQVSLMADIYNQSRETVIWLGEPSPYEDVGTRFLDAHNASSRGAPPQIVWRGDENDQVIRNAYVEDTAHSLFTNGHTNMDIFGAFCLIQELAEGVPNSMLKTLEQPGNSWSRLEFSREPRRPGVWGGLARIMSRPWWTRIWVVQETVLSHKATIHYGMLSAPWFMFAKAAANHVHQCHSQCLDLAGTIEGYHLLNQFSTLVLRIEDTRQHHQTYPNGTTLFSLLWKFKPLEATDKRDKVFAVLGLATTWQGQPPMLPNYEHDDVATFLKTAIDNIQQSGSLTVLAGDLEHVLNRKRLSGLASWAMDWSLPCLATEIERVDSLQMYNAGGIETSTANFHERRSILEVEAIYIDTVEVTGEVSRHSEISETCAMIRQCNLLARGCKKKFGSYPTGGSYEDAFWRTLIGDLIHSGAVTGLEANKRAYRRAEAHDEDAFHAWRMWSRCISRDTLGRTASFTQRDLDEGISSIHYALKTATSSRRFFVTKNGYIGIAPKTTVAGDRAYVFKNSRVPFIVRPHRSLSCEGGRWESLIGHSDGHHGGGICRKVHECFQLVGDCFAYGFMDGKALQYRNVSVEMLYLA